MSDVFRLRGVDIHRVVRCSPVGELGEAPPQQSERDVIGRLDEFTRRLVLCSEYDEAVQCSLQGLDDLFGFPHAILLVRDRPSDPLLAVASYGYPVSAAGAEVPAEVGPIGVAAARGLVVCLPHLRRNRVMQAAIRASHTDSRGEAAAQEIPLPAFDEAQSVAAVPLLAGGEVMGVLYLESEQIGLFGPHNERLLRILGAHVAATLHRLARDDRALLAPVPPHASHVQGGEPLHVTYYQADDSVFVGDAYVVKGVPGRILWKLLQEHAADGREIFTNRELRLDERLGLPAGNDNLEARLLVLRKRLADGAHGMTIDRVGRGRLALRLSRPLALSEIETNGPMKDAHARRATA